MKQLLRVAGWTGILTVFRMAIGFVIVKAVAIYTGPSGLALLGQIQSVVASLNGLVNSPVSSGVVRYTAENYKSGYENCADWWKASIQWVIIISSIIIPFGVIFSEKISLFFFQDVKYSSIVIITFLSLPFTAIGTFITSLVNGKQEYKRYLALGFVSTFASSSLMFFLLYYMKINGAIFAAAIQVAFGSIAVIILCCRQPWFKIKLLFGKATKMAHMGIGNYMLMAITSALTVPVSTMLVRNELVSKLGWEIAGQWQAVLKISEAYLAVVTIALSTYYLPKLSQLIGVNAITKEINSTVRIIFPIVATASLIIYMSRDYIIAILFTEQFQGAKDLFAVQLVGDVLKILSWMYAYPMLSRGASKWFITTEITFSLLYVILSIYLISKLGVIGATTAYVLNYLLYFIFIKVNLEKFCK